MKVLLVSECTKNASKKTQQILDQFAERKGVGCWATEITDQGLKTLKKLLRSSARKNTAVSCHKVGGQHGFELLWVVGDTSKFSIDGAVPTNTTKRDILGSELENDWPYLEGLKIIVQIAALFHDFGKANKLFQAKLRKKGKEHEPFRHEWVSVYLFKHFVGEKLDGEWLEKLSKISKEDEENLLQDLNKSTYIKENNPFFDLINKNEKGTKIARFVLWLILSHHRLPLPPDEAYPIVNSAIWMGNKRFGSLWNSPNSKKPSSKDSEEKIKENFEFAKGTPLKSLKWMDKARILGQKALQFDLTKHDWLEDRFSMQIGRMALMLADHIYSSGPQKTTEQDPSYQVYANTCRETRTLKQRLDEHNIGVAQKAKQVLRKLPGFSSSMPSLKNIKNFKRRSIDPKYQWQDRAYDEAVSVADDSENGGFFGINLASTGCGKTLANAKIIYGLNKDSNGCRFNIALGLRALTLQTGDAIKNLLGLSEEDVAVVIGSDAHKKLHELNQGKQKPQDEQADFGFDGFGAESAEDIFPDEDVLFEDGHENEILNDWFEKNPKKMGYLTAPILVSTIDQVIKATEGHRGGKQIVPILRLLSSDLILDEPDDFGVEDLHALCRLVNYAALLGSKVLISSATLTPSIVEALFEAYAKGRKAYNHARKSGRHEPVVCAWFDESGSISNKTKDLEAFREFHNKFIDKRIEFLKGLPTIRKGAIIPLKTPKSDEDDPIHDFADTILESIYKLHETHSIERGASEHKISVGLLRMANIDPLVRVAKEIFSKEARPEFAIHFCIYHARFPLLIRSKIESILDKMLQRHNPSQIWDVPEIKRALVKHSGAKNHIFIVVATAVAEVGRDHDYDWAIVEPSSMRSIIQLAGRVQRHRKTVPNKPNIHILEKNLRALNCEYHPYSKPGFQNKKMDELSLLKILKEETYLTINSIPRLMESQDEPTKDLIAMEHRRLREDLEQSKGWNEGLSDCTALMQTKFKFRDDDKLYTDYFYRLVDEIDEPKIFNLDKDKQPISQNDLFHKEIFHPGKCCFYLADLNLKEEIIALSEKLELELPHTGEKYASFSLKRYDNDKWFTHPQLGFYRKK